ncbi:putative nuclear envelope protein cut8 protein [Zalerion maritima]|uniref:Tethering factor for nuclear proteasome STS1 n=1 Tax=Zalerion maritima TaxID=339359 RepID=A0AAD5WNF8_9PEZI|nr:putative nuclear envelope protein cut8 protein [Zalerion maritima]
MGISSRKRKADEDGDEMSVSPMNSPAAQSRQLARPTKKIRSINDVFGRPLSLSRLLETLDASQLREVLNAVCNHHPSIGHEIATNTPRPSAESALRVLEDYQKKFRDALPYGHSTSDYTYHRVRQQLVALFEAITDFVPQFLPPIESQNNVSLHFLDGATKIIHNLPTWDSQNYRHHKDGAYDDLARAWALVIHEAAKRGGGFTLHTGGWEQIIMNHHQQSGGRLAAAVDALNAGVSWMGGRPPSPGRGGTGGPSDPNSILSQIVSGNFGSPVRVGP